MINRNWKIQPHAKSARYFYHRVTEYELGRVSPFGHRRVKASWQLTGAFRNHVRPSSVYRTKVSTVCVSKTYVFWNVSFKRLFWPCPKDKATYFTFLFSCQRTNFLQHKNLWCRPRSFALATRGRSPREQVKILWGQDLLQNRSLFPSQLN